MDHIHETCDSKTYENTQGKIEWEEIMKAEIDSLLKNHSWDLVPQPQGKNLVKC